jgi:RNA polymerase II subunit A small phosphatase-like protein
MRKGAGHPTVDVPSVNQEYEARNGGGAAPATPQTDTTTPASSAHSKTPAGMRGSADLRSPGAQKTPMAAAASAQPEAAAPSSAAPVPDFITQTDKYGNASTPRSADAIQGAATAARGKKKKAPFIVDGKAVDEAGRLLQPGDRGADEGGQEGGGELEDACDSLLDNLRMMCCCPYPEDEAAPGAASRAGGGAGRGRGGRSQYANRVGNAQIAYEDVTSEHNVKLLPALHPDDSGKKCLVLDLDETLVHSSFRAVPGADFVIPVQVRYEPLPFFWDVAVGWLVLLSPLCPVACASLQHCASPHRLCPPPIPPPPFPPSPHPPTAQIEDVVHFVYVMKRPGVDEFLVEMAKHYEVVIYTASLNKYADPLLDLLDPQNTIRTRLFRESCVYYEGNYVKDLSLLDRDLEQTIIIDNSPSSYIFHPENAIDCSSFIDDPNDWELDQIGAFLKGIRNIDDVRGTSNLWREWPNLRGVDKLVHGDDDEDGGR